jgi:hypothetical protein
MRSFGHVWITGPSIVPKSEDEVRIQKQVEGKRAPRLSPDFRALPEVAVEEKLAITFAAEDRRLDAFKIRAA